MELPTLEEAEVKGKTVLVRVDINSPVDPRTGEILDDTRIKECAQTLKELAERGAKVVVLAHQGRPGEKDFTTLQPHARVLSKVLGFEVKYVDELLGPSARRAIRELREGEVLLLENVRFWAEESLSKPPGELARTHLVRRLAELVDLYVNDAFAAAHRSQASLVGFSEVLPAFAGRVMERELKGLSKALNPERPCVYVLGGAKVDDSLRIAENVLNKGVADEVLTGGLVGQAFLIGAGVNLGEPSAQALASFEREFKRARELLSTHGDKIKIPVDVAVKADGRKELPTEELPSEHPILDVGERTITSYRASLQRARTAVANGPLGKFEDPEFARGTLEVLRAMASSQAFTIIGGGHTVAAARAAGVLEQINHVSTGGGACISFLSGEKLPAVEALLKCKSA